MRGPHVLQLSEEELARIDEGRDSPHQSGSKVSDSGLVVVPLELSDGGVAGDMEASGPEGDASLVVEEDLPAELFSVAGSSTGVEVEETNGGAF